MKAITIHEPFASLIAHGYKGFETRSWATKHRGQLAIHAGKKIDNDAVMMLAKDYPEIWHKISPLPTGCIVAIANLTECWAVGEDYQSGSTVLFNGENGATKDIGLKEYKFGDYSFGRCAWELDDVKILDKPIPAKGQQGLWNWEDKP